MNSTLIQRGFIAAGIMNIGGVMLFSQAFTNEAIPNADPVVMSNLGLLMICIWGLTYIAAAPYAEKTPWISAAFALEKLVYSAVWVIWMSNNFSNMPALFDNNLFAGMFYSIYGLNDIFFMLFFLWAFKNGKKNT